MRVCWNRQTGTFEGRVSTTYGFKSRHSHQLKKDQPNGWFFFNFVWLGLEPERVWRWEKQYGVLFFSQSAQAGTECKALGRQADSMRSRRQVPSLAPKNRLVKASRFFYPLWKQWYIINNGNFAIVVSHQFVRTVYHHALACIKNFRNDDIQNFVLMICNSLQNWWYTRLRLDIKT